MDSVSQAALGAAVGVAVMGRQRPVWQAALVGAIVGTLPDLDVLIDKGDAVNDMVLHRAETHALLWQFLATFPLSFIFAYLSKSVDRYKRWWVMTVLVLFTHSLLDAMTIYGTRLALPFSDHPFGLGSLFIIDPLYTLPLLLGLLVTGIVRSNSRHRWNHFGLAVSSIYAGWSIAAQAHVTDIVLTSPQAKGIQTEQILVTPTPFNTLLWRIVIQKENSYLEGYYSLLDTPATPENPIRFNKYERGKELEKTTEDFVKANQMRNFTKGFYALSDDGRYISITDLRMGQHPFFVFSFRIAERSSELHEISPQRITQRIPIEPGLAWLKVRILGNDIEPPR